MKLPIKYQLKDKAKLNRKEVIQLPKTLEQQLSELSTVAAVVLALIGVAGLVTVTALAPNALRVLEVFMNKKKGRRPTQKEVEKSLLQTVYYLKKSGKIKVGGSDNSIWFKLTKGGEDDLKKFELNSLYIPKPRNWDGTYWLIAADIPTKTHRPAADAFRTKIMSMGFYPLQRTLWLHPYNPNKEIQFLVNHFNISRFVTLMNVNQLDSQDMEIAKKFWREQGIL